MTRIRTAFALFVGAAVLLVTTIAMGELLTWWMKDSMYIVAIAMSVWASVLYFNIQLNKLEMRHKLKMPEVRLPEIQIHEDLEDDFEAILRGQLTWPVIAGLATLAASTMFIWFLIERNKLGASWGGFNVILVSMLVAGFIVWVTTRTEWFADKSFETPWWAFVIPLSAIIIATSLGLYYTEPIELGGDTPAQIAQRGQEYNYDQTRAGRSSSWININTYRGGSSSSSSGGSSDFDFDCDGKGCAYAILLVLLIVVVLMLIIGSAMIPHFWVFAGILFLAFMFMIAVHNLRYNPNFRRRRWAW